MSNYNYYERINQNKRNISALEELIDRQERARRAYLSYTQELDRYHQFLKTGNVNIFRLIHKIKMSAHYIETMEEQLGTKLTNKQFAVNDVCIAMDKEIKKNYDKIFDLNRDINNCYRWIEKSSKNKE